MAYDELGERLQAEPRELSVAAFPDGSVDTYYRALDGDERVETRTEFCSVLARDRDSLRLRRRQQATGGQSVNMAKQAHALHDEVTLAGHLDDPVFADLPFTTVSLGEPATVSILLFDDGDLMLAEESQDIREWGVEDLRSAARKLEPGTGRDEAADEDPLAALVDADLVCSANWNAFHGLVETFEAIADAAAGGGGESRGKSERGVFVFDPGALGGLADERLRTLLDGLDVLEPAFRTVLTANDVEIEALAEIAGVENGDREAQLTRILDEAGISGAVAHMESRAVAATEEGIVEVANLDTSRVATVTGAGDRFTAGMGHGLAAGWDWDTALALGNTCASYHVVHGETIPREAIADYAERHETTF